MRAARAGIGRSLGGEALDTQREPSPVSSVEAFRSRRIAAVGAALLALACIVSVWPLLASQTVPAFQQDWTWPLSRPLAWQWLRAFAGLWDSRSMGQANALPWQTYAVAVQVALVTVFGAATGLAVWIAALEFLAGWTCVGMLAAFGVARWPARLTAALLYALGPVVFTRIAAGHLAYLLAYALLPAIVLLGKRAIEHAQAANAITLGVVIGLAGSQIQFLAIAWLALLPLATVAHREDGWWRRLLAALGISLCVQLQALLPLAFASTRALYAAQPALLSFEYNNSSPFASAAVMLGYFTHYYEAHAPIGAFWVLYAVLAASLFVAFVATRRWGGFAVMLAAIGTILTAGLYGPLSPLLGWLFENVSYFAVFRDLHYFAALTALGIALALGLALQRLPSLAWLPALGLVVWIASPVLGGAELRELLVPRAYVDDALADMQVAAANGPGRVLWLPAEEPVGPVDAVHRGRDFTAYGPPGNPSVSDDYQNPQLAYALATLRSGAPDWNAFAAMNVRYLVARSYVRSERALNFGTGFPMAFPGKDDVAIGQLLDRASQLKLLRRSALSRVYEFPDNRGEAYAAYGAERPSLYSALGPNDVAVASSQSPPFDLQTSPESADPREGWVAGTLGWRYAPWLPDSIYPFVWTLSSHRLAFDARGSGCVVAAAVPRGAHLRNRNDDIVVRGAWRPYGVTFGTPSSGVTFVPSDRDVSAIASRPCGIGVPRERRPVAVFASGYDAGWRLIGSGRAIAPTLANGWAMAWDVPVASLRLVYVPAILQLAGFVLALAVIGTSIAAVRRTSL